MTISSRHCTNYIGCQSTWEFNTSFVYWCILFLFNAVPATSVIVQTNAASSRRQGLAQLDYRVQGAMVVKYHKFWPKPKTTDELKPPCRPSWKSCHKDTVKMRWGTSSSAQLLGYSTWLWLPVVVTSNICSNSVHLQPCILLSSPTNRLFSEPPRDYWWRQCCNSQRITVCPSVCLSFRHNPVFCSDEWRYDQVVFSIR